MTSMENLPVDVLSNIFMRLLAKQLAQMRSVCKPWNALLSDSSFIKSHLNRSIQNHNDILLFFDIIFLFEHSTFTARTSRSPNLELTNFIKHPVIPECKNHYGYFIGSANGLICFTYVSDRFKILLHIWNPSLSATLSLPPFPLSSLVLSVRFGYDPKTDDYKILKLTHFSGEPNKVKQAEVYSLRTGSWKSISLQTFPSHVRIPKGQKNLISVGDHLHWLCDTGLKSKPQTIVGFDLGEETFHEIPLPDSILHHHGRRYYNALGVLGGKLCVMSCVYFDGGKCEVWVMDNYAVPESWAKHHAFSQFSSDIKPYGFTLNGEFLFQFGVNDDRFGLYDPVAAKTKTFKITSKSFDIMKYVEYVDSLVWVPPPKHEISSCDISQLQIGKQALLPW